MSPRSAEFYAEARKRLRSASAALDGGDPAGAVSAAYYTMLYAARAALSEEDLYAKTHSGTWNLFMQTFVPTSGFPEELAKLGPRTQEVREAADYHARPPSADRAEDVIREAELFLDAVGEMLSAGEDS